MPKLSSLPRPVHPRVLLGGVIAMLALLIPAAAATAAWVREAAPGIGATFQSTSSLSVLPDGSARYLAATGKSSPYTNQLVVRPAAGPVGLASPFPTAFGQNTSDNILSLARPDASGNQLVVREATPFGVAFLAPGADPAGVAVSPTEQITQVSVAPSGEAAAITSKNSEASVSFRPAGPGAAFDAPRKLDRAGKMRSYGIGVTIDPDGGVLVVYRTEQTGRAVLQAYAPPGGDFGPPQLIDVPDQAIGLNAFRYGQSTNGHAVFVWDESTGGDNNSEVAWAVTRSPGGLLGGKTQIATARAGGLVAVSSATATDDGTNYVSVLDAGPIACPNNTREGGAVLLRGTSSGWARLNEPTSGNFRDEIPGLVSAGNYVGVLTLHMTSPQNFCTDEDASSTADVRIGQGAALGAAQTIATENIVSVGRSTILRPRGFAINAGGAAAVLINEPQSAANDSLPFLYYQAGGAGPAPQPTKPLPAPGKIRLSGAKLTARGGQTDFLASCTRLPGEGSKLFCSISALLLLEEKLKGGKASSSAAKPKGKKAKVKLKTIATAKPVKVPVGKTKKVTLKLNKLGKKKLAAAKKAGLKVTLKVTIKRKGYATNTIEKKVKLVAGKAKAKGKGKKGGK